jgi:tetratricopeptide (TPR) repeat protein
VVRNEQGNSALVGSSPIIERLATGYFRVGNEYSRTPLMDMSHGSAGGTMYSTVEDLFRLDRALYNDKLLSKQSRDMMFQPIQSDTSLGWNVRYLSFADLQQPYMTIVNEQGPLRAAASADFKIIYKFGDLWGYSGVFTRFPNEEHSIVVLTNLNNRGIYFNLDTVRITQALTSILYDKPYFTPRERMFAEIIEREGFGKAIALFEQLRRKEPNNPILRENELNRLGYEFLERKKPAQAIEIFKLNVKAFPASANAYDSLAEAYMRNGDRELAIKNYQRVVELNPQNTNAVETLKKLRGQ